MSARHSRVLLIAGTLLLAPGTVSAQAPQSAPPAVGVMKAAYQPMAEQTEINGRIQARERVDIIARVTAFMKERTFEEGGEVKKGDLLYRLERGPFLADVEAKEAAVKQAEAQLTNANLVLSRAEQLLRSNAGTQATVDTSTAGQLTSQGQLQAAKAQLDLARINLDYTEIRSPIDGRIGRTSVTPGNVVSPGSGVLVTVVSEDPVYVVFSVAMSRVIEMRDRFADNGGFDAVRVKLRLPSGKMYEKVGRLNFVDIQVARDTDTLALRATIDNAALGDATNGTVLRELQDGEFVSVILEAVEPLRVLVVPRAAVLTDLQGNYVFVIGEGNKVVQRRVTLGQTTPDRAGVTSGLKEGEQVIVQGLQRARADIVVSPTLLPASANRS